MAFTYTDEYDVLPLCSELVVSVCVKGKSLLYRTIIYTSDELAVLPNILDIIFDSERQMTTGT